MSDHQHASLDDLWTHERTQALTSIASDLGAIRRVLEVVYAAPLAEHETRQQKQREEYERRLADILASRRSPR